MHYASPRSVLCCYSYFHYHNSVILDLETDPDFNDQAKEHANITENRPFQLEDFTYSNGAFSERMFSYLSATNFSGITVYTCNYIVLHWHTYDGDLFYRALYLSLKKEYVKSADCEFSNTDHLPATLVIPQSDVTYDTHTHTHTHTHTNVYTHTHTHTHTHTNVYTHTQMCTHTHTHTHTHTETGTCLEKLEIGLVFVDDNSFVYLSGEDNSTTWPSEILLCYQFPLM